MTQIRTLRLDPKSELARILEARPKRLEHVFHAGEWRA